MSEPLSADEMNAALVNLPGWVVEREALTKTFTLASFPEAMSFMVRVAFEADELDHHPDWTNVYNRVVVRLSTHDAGSCVTAKDVELATRIERIGGKLRKREIGKSGNG